MSGDSGTIRGSIVFEWDPEKARTNLRDHGITFGEAADAFLDERGVTYVDRIEEDGEERLHLIAATQGTALLLVVHTYRNHHGEYRIRIISARKATPQERTLYRDQDG